MFYCGKVVEMLIAVIVIYFCWIVIGLQIMSNPKMYIEKYKMTLDFSGFNIVFGGVMILYGVVSIWLELKKVNSKETEDDTENKKSNRKVDA